MRYYLIIFLTSILLISSPSFYAQEYRKIDRVVIDAGHGGKDPGAIGKKSYEKDIALSISLKVGKYIQDNLPDVNVSYTRKTDVFIELHKRPKIANDAKADVFISIHCNSVGNSKPVGTETFIIGATKDARNLAVAQKENASILLESDYEKNYNNFDPKSPESYIIFELFSDAYRKQSISIANKVQNQFSNSLKRVDRGVKEGGLLVLVNAAMPSILVEVGFISNPEEEKYLMSESGQNEIASAIYRAFKEYKYSMERGLDYKEADITPKDSIVKIEKPIEAATPKLDTTTGNILFSVQFLTAKSVINENSHELKNLEGVWYYRDGKYYKYVAGKFKNLNDANTYATKVRSTGFGDAFVVAFLDGVRIPKKKALEMLKE